MFTVHFNLFSLTDCPTVVDPVPIILGVLIPIVVIGIIAIVAYKYLTDLYDRRQLAQFDKEVAGASWRVSLQPVMF